MSFKRANLVAAATAAAAWLECSRELALFERTVLAALKNDCSVGLAFSAAAAGGLDVPSTRLTFDFRISRSKCAIALCSCSG
eukprot:11724-Heterococcus_DN1.PRE.2